jgi:hypothetical protein
MGYKPRRTNTSKSIDSAAIRHIARQVKRMSDAEVFTLSMSADRTTRRIASQVAHQRAEAYAMDADGLR